MNSMADSAGMRRYHPNIFHDMIEKHGGLQTAHLLLKPEADLTYGFHRLCELKKAHLTMEAMILDLDYSEELFTAAELRTADERLKAAEQMSRL